MIPNKKKILITLVLLLMSVQSMAYTQHNPSELFYKVVDKTLQIIKEREVRDLNCDLTHVTMNKSTNINKYIKPLYKSGCLEASSLKLETDDLTLDGLHQYLITDSKTLNLALANKAIMAKVLEYYLQEDFTNYHPKTLLIFDLEIEKESLLSLNFEDQRSWIKNYLLEQFPEGQLLIKPSNGLKSDGKGFIFDFETAVDFIHAILNPNINPEQLFEKCYLRKWVERELKDPSTFIIQQKVKIIDEVRGHTLWGLAPENMILDRYSDWNFLPVRLKTYKNYAHFLQNFLDSLPESLKSNIAWSVDIAHTPRGYYILDVNTNRAKPIVWSGFLHFPKVYAALVHNVRDHLSINITGKYASLILQGYGNIKKSFKKYQEKRKRDKAQDKNLSKTSEGQSCQ